MKMLRIAVTPVTVFIATVIAQVANLRVGAQPWPGEVLLSTTWVWTATYLTGPILTTVAAWDGARLFPRRGATVWDLPSTGRRLRARLWLFSVVAGVVPTVAVVVWMSTQFGVASAGAIASALFTMVAGIATVAGFIGAGLALGSWWGKVYGTLVAFAGSLMAQMVSYLGALPILMVGGVSDSLLGLRLSWGAVAVHTLGLALLVGLAAFSLFTPGTRSIGPVEWGGVVLAAWFLLALVIPNVDAHRFVPDSAMGEGTTCVELRADTRPPGHGQLCMAHQHRRLHVPLAELWGAMSTAAAEGEVRGFPGALHELPPAAGPADVPPGAPGSIATFTMTKEQLDALEGSVTLDWLAASMTAPTWCPGLWGEEPPGDELWEASDAAREALITLVEGRSPEDRAQAARQFEAAWDTLRACPGLPG